MDIPAHVKAAIRYILNPQSPMFNIDDLKWTTSQQIIVVYRGQCNVSAKNIPRLGSNPLEISTNYKRPISTTLVLNQYIEQFACAQPGGRIFEIHVTPGVKYAFLSNSVQGFDINRDEVFQFLKDELAPGHFFKTKSLGQIRAAFFSRLSKEREVVFDPRTIAFVNEAGSPETWDGPSTKSVLQEVDKRGKPTGITREVDSYKTFMVAKKGGRGRSLRTHSTRRNKNGRRFARKSKGSRHGRH
jgi:hypothetical protein